MMCSEEYDCVRPMVVMVLLLNVRIVVLVVV